MGPTRLHLLLVTLMASLCLLCLTHGAEPLVHGRAGGVAEMACSLDPPDIGNPSPLHVVEWIRLGFDIPILIKFGEYMPRVHPIYEGRVSLVRGIALRVEGLLLEDEGWYECRVLLLNTATDETRNGTWTLLSVTAPPIFTETPSDVMETVVGKMLSLTCVAHGNPLPTITWEKDGVVIREEEEMKVLNGTLSVQSVSRDTAGEYTCHASNKEGNLTHVSKVRVKGPPVIIIPPKDTALNMSQDALLRCQAEAEPGNMTYTWQRQGENVYHIESMKSRVKILVDGTLLIPRLIPEDSGKYTCIPSNGLLNPPTASAHLIVRHPAQVLQMPRQTYLPTGMGGSVKCPVIAQPPLLHVDWTKDGEPLDLGMYPGWTLTSDGSLFMATANDDVAGEYTCTPYNSYGTMGRSEPTTVILQDPPSLRVPPRKEYRQEVGRMLIIPCQTDGDTTPIVTWSKVGSAPRSQFTVTANGSLLLQPLSKDHQGVWECRAANRVANVSASTLVLVLGTSPHAVSSVAASPGINQANVSWEAGFDGGYTQKFTIWLKQMSAGDRAKKQEWVSVPVPASSGHRLLVTGLLPSTEYQFSVLAHNKMGSGPFSEITSVRTLDPPPETIKLEPPTSLSANQTAAGIVLHWSLPSSSFITGFVLQSRAEQGEWIHLDEEVSVNSSEMLVERLSKDSMYELRLLSRQGDVLSMPSASVNVSTFGMDVYPSSSRLLEFVPEPLLAGIMGGVGFLALALLLVLGTGCVISHKRGQQRKKKREDLPLALFKNSSIKSGPLTGSPDSMLKQKLFPPHSLYPSSSSSTQSNPSSFDKDGRNIFRDQCQLLLSNSPVPPHYTFKESLLNGGLPSPTSQLEFISRGPDGRFILQPYEKPSIPTARMKMNLGEDFPQTVGGREMSRTHKSRPLQSQSDKGKDPPFIVSVDLPPSGTDTYPTGVGQAMAQQISLQPRFFFTEEKDCSKDNEDKESLYSDSSGSMTFPQIENSPGYLSLKQGGQLSTTSTLVLQMEHERESGNLSRCLKLAQERTELERELQKYVAERSCTEEESGKLGREETQSTKAEEIEQKLKPNCITFQYGNLQAIGGHCVSETMGRPKSKGIADYSSPSYSKREYSPLILPTDLTVPTQTPSKEVDCVEMSVDEPKDEGQLASSNRSILLQQHETQECVEPCGAEKDRIQPTANKQEGDASHNNSVPRAEVQRGHSRFSKTLSAGKPPRTVLWKSRSLESQRSDCHQSTPTLDSKRLCKSKFLAPDAWVNSLSPENVYFSSALSIRPRSLFSEPQAPQLLEIPFHKESPFRISSTPSDPLAQGRKPPILSSNPAAPFTCHSQDPSCQASTNCPIIYQEALGSVQCTDEQKDLSVCPNPIGLGNGDSFRPSDSECSPLMASLHSTCHIPFPPIVYETKVDKEGENEVRRYPAQEADGEMVECRGVSESEGSYSSYASQSSGRGSLEPSNGHQTLSGTTNSSPEPIKEKISNSGEKGLLEMRSVNRRRTSVDESYEWDTSEVSMQPEDLFLSVSQMPAPLCDSADIQSSKMILNVPVQPHGTHINNDCFDPEIDAVMF